MLPSEPAQRAGHKGSKCHSAIDCPKCLIVPVVAIRQWLWQALEKEEDPTSLYPIRDQLARDLGFLLARAVVVHHQEHVASQQP